MYQLYGTYPTTTPVCTPLCPCCSVLLLVVLCWLLPLPTRSIGCLPSVKQSKRSTPRASGLYRWEHSNSTLSKFQLTTKLICMSSSKWRLVALLAAWSCTPTPVSLLCPINTSWLWLLLDQSPHNTALQVCTSGCRAPLPSLMSSITNTVPHQPWEYSTAPPPVSNNEPCDVRELVKVHAHITTALLLVVSHWALLYTAQLSQANYS